MRTLYCFFLLILLIGNGLFAQQTRYVIIAVIDGARYSETFGDPVHQYIPRLWNDLRPLGTIYTSFYVDGYTTTNPGHSSILTGTWQYIANNGTERPHKPTIFEYYRKEKAAAIEDCYVILGKDKLNILAYSDHGEYGYSHRALVKFSSSQYDDKVTLNNFHDVINISHPRLAIVNFAETDNSGHSGVWSRYVSSIHAADSLIYVLWQTIQSDSMYGGKTTLIITGDHGRHLDGVADGFKSHGDTCEGCRHVATMILGPDTPAGAVDSTRQTQIDIAPTIGQLLKFTPLYSEGSVISSAIVTEVNSESFYLPRKIKLMQNYPNPFNPSTTLRFSLPETELITLKVYTALGEEVANLAEGVIPPGAYDMKWNADGFPSGVYFCKLTANGDGGPDKEAVFVNKMMLIK